MKTVDLTDPELAEYSRCHLLYELKMFAWTCAQLDLAVKKSDACRSALLESFGMHLRNLIDFFYTPRKDDDDVIAADFCPGWIEKLPTSLKEAKTRANKEFSHLTLARKGDRDPTKDWKVGELFAEVHGVVRTFAVRASPTKLHDSVRDFLNLPLATAVAVVASTSMSNTATTMFISGGGAPPSKNSAP